MQHTISLSFPKADRQFRSLTGLNQTEFIALLEVFDLQIRQKQMFTTLKNQPRSQVQYNESSLSSLYGSEKKLWFILLYMKENPNQSYHGFLFTICQAKVSEWISFLLPVLEKSLSILGVMPQFGGSFTYSEQATEWLLVDVVEQAVPRATDYDVQREEYSGKKKMHTQKCLAICEPNQKIVYLSSPREGKMHDKAIWDEEEIDIQGGITLLADLGFLGIEKDYPSALLPFKKPKEEELSKHKKEINRQISSVRVTIEHAFAGVKRLKIVRNKMRLKTWLLRESVMKIAVAFHNLRVKYRSM